MEYLTNMILDKMGQIREEIKNPNREVDISVLSGMHKAYYDILQKVIDRGGSENAIFN